MDRRVFLTTIPAAASGCLSVGGSRTATRPEPPAEAGEPPAFPDADEVHYPASGGGPIVVTADPSTAELPGATIEFRATNVGGRRFETNLYDWRLHKYVDGTWWFLGVLTPLSGAYALDEGDTNVWEATVDNDKIHKRPTDLSPSSDSSFTLAGVGSGLYAFSIVGMFGHSGPTVAAVTPFELEGETVELRPTTTVETSSEGETVSVTSSSSRGDEYEMTARRRPTTDDAFPLVPEWGLRQEGIRNTVPFLGPDVETVVYSLGGHPPVIPMQEIEGTTVGTRDYEFGFVDGTAFTDGDSTVEFEVRGV